MNNLMNGVGISMALFCMNCNQHTQTIPCEHCGNFFNVAAQFELKLTPEQAENLARMLPHFDVSQLVGLPCSTCGELFTGTFFDAGGTVIRASDDRWQHDHCRSQN